MHRGPLPHQCQPADPASVIAIQLLALGHKRAGAICMPNLSTLTAVGAEGDQVLEGAIPVGKHTNTHWLMP